MKLISFVGRILFSNYKSVDKEHKPSYALVKRMLIPKSLNDWGRRLHDRKIEKSYVYVRHTQNHVAIDAAKEKNASAITDYTSSSKLKTYTKNVYECQLLKTDKDTDWFNQLSSDDIVSIKEDIEKFAHWLCAHPNYMDMTETELQDAFHENWQQHSKENPKDCVNASILHEATNFALHVFFKKNELESQIKNLHQKKMDEQMVRQFNRVDFETAYNRSIILSDYGNAHIRNLDNTTDYSSTDNTPYHEFDQLSKYERQKILDALPV